VGCIFTKCIPRQVQAQQPETKQQCVERIPILYVPLRDFGCLGDLFERSEYHNLLHFVRKPLHSALTALKSCTSFTNGLQTVAYRENSKFDVP
jgi:hypothetical protein